MKLLSDFDGVWTYPDEEGAAHAAELDAALVAAAGEGHGDAARGWIARARKTVREQPTRWGWASHGRITAFADEDPFTEHGALLQYLSEQRPRDAMAERMASAIEAEGQTLDRFGGECHVRGVARVEASRGPGITVAAAAAGRELLAGGVEVVVVSNSGTEKLARWFAHAHVDASVHPERAERALRLRGAALKFALASGTPQSLAVGSLHVDVARPHYAKALAEESPDAIVGDVFSLDLALPLHLKRTEAAWKHVRLFWLAHAYTPARMRREIAKLPVGEVEVVEGGLPVVAERLLAGR